LNIAASNFAKRSVLQGNVCPVQIKSRTAANVTLFQISFLHPSTVTNQSKCCASCRQFRGPWHVQECSTSAICTRPI